VYPYGGSGGMDTVEEHYHPMNYRPKVKDVDREDSDMGEDMMIEVELVEREHESKVLVRYWTGDRAERHRQARQEWDELVKLWCLKDHTTFVSQNSNCST
jgi:hypothetical protein